MMTATQTMTAGQILDEISKRGIALVPALDLWMASVDEKGTTISTKSRKIRSISATDSSPIGAVTALLAILDARPQEEEEDLFWDEEPPF